jgi:hypothetical protein
VEIEGLLRHREETLKELDGVERQLAAPAPAMEDLAEQRDYIEQGRRAVSEIEIILAERAKESTITKSKAQKEQQLDGIERALEVVGPKGAVRGKLLRGGVNPFVVEVNTLLRGLGLGDLTIDYEPWCIKVDGMAAVMLSESERWRLGAALAGIFAKRSGGGMLCLDGAEILDADNRELLIEVLEACGLEQVIVATTGVAPDEPVDGWQFYCVTKREDGVSLVSEAHPVPSAA